jgi:predicted esterase YcpF (UPF0227 family)
MLQTKLLFYFNGFNSAILDDYSGSAKIIAVAEYAQSRGYGFIPVSVCYRLALEQSREILALVGESVEEVIFCGSSMGGWFARIMQLLLSHEKPGIKSSAIAFNPAYDLAMYGYMLVGPQVNYVTQEEYRWTVEHSEQLKTLERSVDYKSTLPFFVYVDKGDEVIGWEGSAAKHSPISKFIAFEGGCHSFDHFREALLDFDTATIK